MADDKSRFDKQQLANDALRRTLRELESTIRESFADFNKFERAAASLGMDYGTASTRLADSMEGLRGGIDQQLAAALTATEAGLMGNTQGINQLINQQRLTGLSGAKTAKTMAALENELGMSREATNALGPQIIDLGKKFSISTDTLVDSIGGLSSSFRTLNLVGIGDQFAGTMTLLQAEFGEGNSKILGQFMTEFLNPSLDTLGRLSALGVEDLRRQALAEKDQRKQAELIKKAMVMAADKATQFVGSSEESLLLAGVLRESFGEIPGIAKQLSNSLERGLNEEQKVTADFFNTLNNLKDEALSPLKQLFMDLMAEIKPLLPEFSAFVKEGLQTFADGVRTTIAEFGGMRPALIALKDGFLTTVSVLKIAFEAYLVYLGSKVVKTGFAFAKNIPVIFATIKSFFSLSKITRGFGIALTALRGAVAFLGGPVTLITTLLGYAAVKLGLFNGVIDKVKSFFGFGGDSAVEGLKEKHDLTNETLAQTKVVTHDLVGHVKRGADATEKMAGTTTSTSADFMTETANILSRSVESILGIESDDSAAELVELIREQNGMIASSDRGTKVAFAPQDNGRD